MPHAKTQLVNVHGKEPILAVDFHPSGILATSGGDKEVKLWDVKEDDNGDPKLVYRETLSGHSRAVNCIRFSPSGEILASAGDAGEVMLWRPSGGGGASGHEDSGRGGGGKEQGGSQGSGGNSAGALEEGVCTWKASACLRGHNNDVMDLSWAPNSDRMLSGSVDNTSIVWDTNKAKALMRMDEHSNYVQGVAWDPTGRLLATQSADRSCRVFASVVPCGSTSQAKQRKQMTLHDHHQAWAKHLQCLHTMKQREYLEQQQPAQAQTQDAETQEVRSRKHLLFHDDTLASFFRRLAWAPEGSCLVVPAGVYKKHAGSASQHCLYIYSRDTFSQPAAIVPGFPSAVVAVRFCPVLFTRRNAVEAQSATNHENTSSTTTTTTATNASTPSTSPNSGFTMPYRLVFAVATLESVMILDTEQSTPSVLLSGIHCAAITDLAWSRDGSKLAICSYDGFCSVATFKDGELGRPFPLQDLPPHLLPVLNPEPATEEVPVSVSREKANEGSEPQLERSGNPSLTTVVTNYPNPNETNAGDAEEVSNSEATNVVTNSNTTLNCSSTQATTDQLAGTKRRISPVEVQPVKRITPESVEVNTIRQVELVSSSAIASGTAPETNFSAKEVAGAAVISGSSVAIVNSDGTNMMTESAGARAPLSPLPPSSEINSNTANQAPTGVPAATKRRITPVAV